MSSGRCQARLEEFVWNFRLDGINSLRGTKNLPSSHGARGKDGSVGGTRGREEKKEEERARKRVRGVHHSSAE